MQTPPRTLDASAVRDWCALALEGLGRDRERIDAINVFPVADGDTGTNLYLTVESAARAVEAVFEGWRAATAAPPDTGAPRRAGTTGSSTDVEGPADPARAAATGRGDGGAPGLGEVVRAMAHGALIGARGNSGTILAQLLRGVAQVLGEPGSGTAGPEDLARALRTAADAAYAAVARPAEGTMLTVAAAAARAGEQELDRTPGQGGGPGAASVAAAARDAAAAALAATPGQLSPLRAAGVVDAGGTGLVDVLAALALALGARDTPGGQATAATRPARSGTAPEEHQEAPPRPAAGAAAAGPCPQAAVVEAEPDTGAPHFEVIYLLEAGAEEVGRLRERLDRLGDSLVVIGGDGLWNVHVHVDDAGAAVEAGIEAGRPHRVRITHLDTAVRGHRRRTGPAERAVVAVVPGDGLAALCRDAGATAVIARPGEPPASGELVQAVRTARAREVVVLLNDPALHHTAAVAAHEARGLGVRVAVVPTRAAVQGLAALAVHAPERGFDEDVVAMTSAAGATRYAEVQVAERQSWTTAGVCQAGDVLGLIEGDVALIGGGVVDTAASVLDRMLSAGGELVTLVVGADAPEDLAEQLQAHVREHHLAVDTVAYQGGRHAPPLLIGVE